MVVLVIKIWWWIIKFNIYQISICTEEKTNKETIYGEYICKSIVCKLNE